MGKGQDHAAEYKVLVGLLRELRTKAGLTQAGLAEALGKPQSYVSKVERCERLVDPVELRSIAEACGRDVTTVVREWVKRAPH